MHVTKPQKHIELERILVTRFRTGSHSLQIEIGRYSNTLRETRLCLCGEAVQTVWHIFMECDLTSDIGNRNYLNIHEILELIQSSQLLLSSK